VGVPDKETIFIGHSMGCQALLRYVEKLPLGSKVRCLIFVAGWFNLANLENEEVKRIAKPWIRTPINFNNIKQKARTITVFLSDNEPYGYSKENEQIFKEKLGAAVVIEENKGHFTYEDGVTEVPEVLEVIKSKLSRKSS